MFSLTEKALSQQSKQQLSATASYHGSLFKMRLQQVMKATGVFAGLLFVIAGVTFLGFWFFDEMPELQRLFPIFFWASIFMYGFVLMVSLWDSRYSHEFRCESKRLAQAALQYGKESKASVTFDETSFALPHEHGVLFFVDDGQGGSVVLNVSTISDDPCEAQARAARISTCWQLDCVAGGIRKARFSGKKMPIRLIEGLDQHDALSPEQLLEWIGLASDAPLSRSPVQIHETERRVRELLGSKV